MTREGVGTPDDRRARSTGLRRTPGGLCRGRAGELRTARPPERRRRRAMCRWLVTAAAAVPARDDSASRLLDRRSLTAVTVRNPHRGWAQPLPPDGTGPPDARPDCVHVGPRPAARASPCCCARRAPPARWGSRTAGDVPRSGGWLLGITVVVDHLSRCRCGGDAAVGEPGRRDVRSSSRPWNRRGGGDLGRPDHPLGLPRRLVVGHRPRRGGSSPGRGSPRPASPDAGRAGRRAATPTGAARTVDRTPGPPPD
jgi:hypothetical protein